jgi:D-glycero-D-manno-heptose 1,7-bisphosphate phosphatase
LNRRCVFLDRDGVINEKPAPHQHIRSWSEFRFLPNIADWVRMFNTLGYLVIVVTNQRGMARETVEEIHGSMIRELLQRGARIDDVFVCPHEEDSCDCRKPKPGLVLQAQKKWRLDLAKSLMIGDSDEDAALAAVCGLSFLRVDGHGHLVP